VIVAPDPVHVLRFVSGKYEGQEFPLEDGKTYIAGRSSEVDLVLADDAVSRKHARFFKTRGRLWVRDLGSRNGTLINGESVARHCLRAGDRIAIGSSLARVDLVERNSITKNRAGENKRKTAEATANRSMSGSLEDIPLMDVLQWLATSRKTGTLKVKDPLADRVGALHLREGQVFYATITGAEILHPEKALLRMLNWSRGSFDLESTALEQVGQEISMSLEHVLMEAARQEDELKNIAKKTTLPRAGDLVQIVKPSPVPWHALDEKEIGLLQALYEKVSWWDVLDTSPLDDVSLTRTLVALKKKGVVGY
jgi:pSer/pThr/pTyr-binding forkhead associated (FHA) protein